MGFRVNQAVCCVLMWLFWVNPAGLLAQESKVQSADSEAYILTQTGDELWLQAWRDSALQTYIAAEALALDASDQVALWHRIGKCYVRSFVFDSAAVWLDKAIGLAETVGPLHPDIMLARAEKANIIGFGGEFEEALRQVKQLVSEAEGLVPRGDSLRAELLHRLGIYYIYNRYLDSAETFSQQALAIKRRIYPPEHLYLAHTLNSLGSIQSERDQNEAALRFYEEGLDIMRVAARPGHTQTIQMLTNMAVVYRGLGLNWEAQRLYDEMLPYLEQISPEARFILLLHYASSLEAIGSYHKALRYLQRAEAVWKAHPYVHPNGRSWLEFEQSGAFHSMGNYSRALDLIQSAIAREEAGGLKADYSDWILYHAREGTILMNLRQPKAAIASFSRPLALKPEQWPDGYDMKGWIQEYLGEAYIADMAYQQAIQTLHAARQTYTLGGNPWNLIGVHFKMARAWRMQSAWDSAFAYHQLAWEYAMPELPFQLHPDTEKVLQYWNRPELADLMEDQGMSLEARFAETGDSTDWRAAVACYETYLALFNESRRNYIHPSSRRYGVEAQLPVYERLLAMHAKGHPSQSQIWKALNFATQSKANNLRQHLHDQVALKISGLPDSLLRQELMFRQRLLAIDQYEAEAGPSDSLKLTHIELYQDYQGFLSHIQAHYPAYYQLRFATEALDPLDMQQHLGEKTLLYSYFLGQLNLYVFKVSGSQAQIFEQPLTDSLNQQIDDWLAFVSQPPHAPLSFEELLATGKELQAVLLPDLPEGSKELFVVPHGKLALFPLESLPLADSRGDDLREWQFLGMNFPVRYAYAEVLGLDQAVEERAGASYLGFAPEFAGSVPIAYRDSLGPLAYNQSEVGKAAKLFNGKALRGGAAHEAVLKSLDERPYILHFATHALADSSSPLQARIFLESDPESGEDGLLHAWEIYAQQWQSPLTVLSACQTGLGKLESGEGVMSLARAFQYAGSKQVLTTLWQTDDQAGATLTSHFLTEVAQQEGTHIALQHARQQWLAAADPFKAHPFFWAGYVLIGDGAPIKPATKSSWLIWSLLLLVVAGAAGFIWKKGRARN